MRNISRREFMGGALALSAAMLAPRSARAADARVEILVGEQIGTVAPEIYSHFIEHILTVVDPHHNQPREAEVTVRGASVSSCRSRVLTSTDIRAHNTFANPRALEPMDGEVRVSGPTFVYRFAPASVTRLRMSLV